MSSFRSQSSQSLHLGCSLLCSPDYHSAHNAPQCANAAAFTLQSEYKEMDKTTIKSENLETYSFMLRKCKQSAWFLSSTLAFVQGGRGRRGTGRGSKTIWFRFPTVYRLSNFHARSQFTPNNVSKHSGAIFHGLPADFFGHRSQKIVTILTKEPLLICIACGAGEKVDEAGSVNGDEEKLEGELTIWRKRYYFCRQFCGCQPS